MNTSDLLTLRLANQQISQTTFTTPHEIVSWMGAMQAQDYPGALWAIGLRLPGSTLKDIEKAADERTIVRTWPMRGTLHLVAAEDIRWMTELMATKVMKGGAARRQQLGLDDETFGRCRDIFMEALEGDRQLSRKNMLKLLNDFDISTEGQRGIHILARLCMEGLLCFAAHVGKEPHFALLNEWVPSAKSKPHDESLAEITKRYFTSHGPATIRDFTWWSGLTIAETKAGIAANSAALTNETIDGKEYWLGKDQPKTPPKRDSVYLLPGFDEYMLGYTDRTPVLDPLHSQKVVPGNNGMFLATIVADGTIEGIWKKKLTTKKVSIEPISFTSLTPTQLKNFTEQSKRYSHFLGLA